MEWDTRLLFADDHDARATGTRLVGRCEELGRSYRDHVGLQTADGLAGLLAEYGALHATMSRLAAYGAARVTVRLDDAAATDLSAFVDDVAADVARLLSFVAEEWAALSDEHAAELYDAPQLAPHRAVLLAARTDDRMRPPPEDTAPLDVRDPAASDAWAALYDLVLDRVTVRTDGGSLNVDEALAQGACASYASREQTLGRLHRELATRSAELAHCLDTLVADRLTVDEIRGADGARAERDADNGIEPAAVETALRAVHDRRAVAHRWYRAKAVRAGRIPIRFPHLKAPPAGAGRFGFDDAAAIVVAAFGRLGPEQAGTVERIFTERRVDDSPRRGKIGSSLCIPAGTAPPYVLLNFTGSFSDVLTLAHEVGHAVHHTRAAAVQGPLGCDPPTLVGEVVASFAELLVADHLVRTGHPHVRTMRADAVVDAVFRQAALTRFEDGLYAERAGGTVLDAPRLDACWLAEMRSLHGEAVEIDDCFGCGWALVPHFFRTRYYNYSYVLATLAALVLRSSHRADAGSAAGVLDRLMTFGGSLPADRQLREIGIDPADPGTWTTALDELAALTTPTADPGPG